MRDNSLSIVFGLLFLGALVGQSIAGYSNENELLTAHQEPTMSYGDYVTSSSFGVEMLENWQSEYLQFTLFILATIWLFQRGSNESKQEEELGLETDEQQRVGRHADERSPRWARTKDWRYQLYANSLIIVMVTIFIGSWFGQSVTGMTNYNEEQQLHDQAKISWVSYVGKGEFWERTLSNWQSEFLAVGSMAIFTVYLRQRGSPESKPVGAPHGETASSG
ncbi:MAG TPA: DUF6766 family protein [Gaiellaceae bacterium]|nr:DUF6766 family protein [Gaiellaceae bacterium]